MLLDCKDSKKKNYQLFLNTEPGWKHVLTLLSVLDSAHAACSATATQSDSTSSTSLGSHVLPASCGCQAYTSRDHGIRRTQGQEGRLAVTGRVTWCSMIRRHDNPAAMLSIQQHKLYEGLEGGDNERVAELQEAPLLVTGSKASTWSVLFFLHRQRNTSFMRVKSDQEKVLHSNFCCFLVCKDSMWTSRIQEEQWIQEVKAFQCF